MLFEQSERDQSTALRFGLLLPDLCLELCISLGVLRDDRLLADTAMLPLLEQINHAVSAVHRFANAVDTGLCSDF